MHPVSAIWQTFEIATSQDTKDEELFSRFLVQKDGDAFRELYRRHSKSIYLLCRRILKCEHLANDALQDVFTKVAIKGHTYRQEASFGFWLMKVAYNQAITHYRQKVKKRKREQSLPNQLASESINAIGDVDRENQREKLYSLLDTMPWKYRIVLELCEVQELTHAQAARQLGLPKGTVHTHVREGRKKLAEKAKRAGLSSLTLGTAFAAKSEAMAPPLAAATLEFALNATSTPVVFTITHSWFSSLQHQWSWAIACLSIVVLASGIAYIAYEQPENNPASARITFAAIKPLELTRRQKKWNHFNDVAVPKLLAAVDEFPLYGSPRLISVIEKDDSFECLLEASIEMGNPKQPIVTSRLRAEYFPLKDSVKLMLDPKSDGHWQMCHKEPGVIIDFPSGHRLNLRLASVDKAWSAFNELIDGGEHPLVDLPGTYQSGTSLYTVSILDQKKGLINVYSRIPQDFPVITGFYDGKFGNIRSSDGQTFSLLSGSENGGWLQIHTQEYAHHSQHLFISKIGLRGTFRAALLAGMYRDQEIPEREYQVDVQGNYVTIRNELNQIVHEGNFEENGCFIKLKDGGILHAALTHEGTFFLHKNRVGQGYQSKFKHGDVAKGKI